MRPLTLKQYRVLEAFKAYYEEHGVSPRLSDLCEELGISKAAVHEHLLALTRKGRLVRHARSERNYKLAESGPDFLAIGELQSLKDDILEAPHLNPEGPFFDFVMSRIDKRLQVLQDRKVEGMPRD